MPQYPQDFAEEHADGGVTFKWWQPNGRECRAPIGEDLPEGIIVGQEDDGEWCVGWMLGDASFAVEYSAKSEFEIQRLVDLCAEAGRARSWER